MTSIMFLIGRFHPLWVHLPIGILVLAFIFELLATWRKFRYLKASVRPSLLIGALSAIVASITGYFLSEEGGYDDDLLALHQYMGISTAAFALLLYFVRGRVFTENKIVLTRIRILLFLILISLLSFTGHLGGSLTHGEEYLFEIPDAADEEGKQKVVFKPIANMDDAILYADIIQPILETKCYSCHSAKKQKGKLRLDGIEYINRGGEDGAVLEAGVPDSSSLYHRLILPLEDEEHMPPHEKTQLSSAEIDLVHLWVADGFSFDKKVAAYKEHEKIKNFISAVQLEESPKENWLPEEEVSRADDNKITSLKDVGALIMPVTQESNYLMVNCINAKSFTEKEAALLLPLKDHIVWLDLSNIKITDSVLKEVGQLHNLRYLYLQNTKVTDVGMKEIAKLANLQYLNLVGTDVTDNAVASLVELKNLKEVFMYRTKLTSNGVKQLTANHANIRIDTGGYFLPSLQSDTVVYKREN